VTKHFQFLMAKSTPPNLLKRQRQLSDSDTDSDLDNDFNAVGTWPRFLMIEATVGHTQELEKLSNFAIRKGVEGLTGTTTKAKQLRSGSILVEVTKEAYANNLLGSSRFVDIPVKVSAHRSMNTSKGVVRSYELRNSTETEMKEELKMYKVIEVRRILVRRNGVQVPTNTFILSFALPKPPTSIKAGYISIPVDPYVPNPLRCFKCQRFGHHQSNCKADVVCPRCSQKGHDGTDCNEQVKCANCKGNHPVYARDCPVWKREKEVQRIKSERNISFPEARKIVEALSPPGSSGPSYADAARIVQNKVTTVCASTQTDMRWPDTCSRPLMEVQPSIGTKSSRVVSKEVQTQSEPLISTKPKPTVPTKTKPTIPPKPADKSQSGSAVQAKKGTVGSSTQNDPKSAPADTVKSKLKNILFQVMRPKRRSMRQGKPMGLALLLVEPFQKLNLLIQCPRRLQFRTWFQRHLLRPPILLAP
jgi:hypothetical protein